MAFTQCNISSVTIPETVTEIGLGAFAACSKITSITMPARVTSIGNHVFDSCTNLTSVTFQGNINSRDFDYFAFGDPTGSNSLVIDGQKTKYIGNLREAYLASDGGQGTYKRFANGEVWKKQ
jgi:hypothetical protein